MSSLFYDSIRRYGLEDIPRSFPAHQLQEMEEARDDLLAGPVILAADNVARYFEEHEAGFSYDFARDCPNLAPPFEGGFFVETANPGILDARQGHTPSKGFRAERWGLYLKSTDFVAMGERWQEEAARQTCDRGGESPRAADATRAGSGLTGGLAGVPRWLLSYSLFVGLRGNPRAVGPVIGGILGVLESGSVARWADGVEVNLGLHYGNESADDDSVYLMHRMFRGLCFPLFLAVSFLHCKNVVIEQASSHKKPSKKALKRGAKNSREGDGVRYHTLRIEPMKEVLRTEGAVNEQGLKRALHITRGHFKHYTPERGGLFGRRIEEPETVWVAQHVRGSSKRGAVEKDYQIESPAREPSWEAPERSTAHADESGDRQLNLP